ncbi:uncharacterized protein HaLaN_12739, partial [Haematococcus lacustris]
VTAAFDAPVAGALFAIEFVLKSSRLGLDRLSTSTVFVATSVAAGVEGFLRSQGQGYKKYYFNNFLGEEEGEDAGSQSIGMRVSGYESPLDFRSPMGFTFYLSILSE